MPATILIVEDEPAILELIAASLRRVGHRPVLAESVEQAQRCVEEVLPDLVILDDPISSFDGMISAAGLYMSYFSLPSALPTATVSFAIFSRFKTAEKCHVWRFIALGACTAHCKSVSIFSLSTGRSSYARTLQRVKMF